MISVIIPSHNGYELLRRNLPPIIEELDKINNSEIIIVDNNSDDNTKELIREFTFPILHLKLSENHGFIKPCNFGSLTAKNDYIMFMNNDMVPEKDFFVTMLRKIKKSKKLFAVTPLVLFENTDAVNASSGNITISSKTSKISFHYEKNMEKIKKDEYSRLFHGGSALLNKKIFFKLGGFSNLYSPMYKESYDLSIKAGKSGCRILFTPDAKIIHAHRSTTDKVFSEFFMNYLIERNQNLLEFKHLSGKKLVKNIAFKLKNCLSGITINGKYHTTLALLTSSIIFTFRRKQD